MLIEIRNVQFVNKGAELMLYAILQQLEINLPEAEVCLAPSLNSPYKKRAKIGALQKVMWRKNRFDFNWLSYMLPKSVRSFFKERYGIVSEADIDVILDASGFAYGDQWSDLVMRQTANEVERLRRKGKKYIFLPQSLGPFTRPANKKWAKKAFTNASLVFPREVESVKHVRELVGNLPHIHQAPDFTNLVEAAVPASYSCYRGAIVIIPNSKMLSEKNSEPLWVNNYVFLLSQLIEEFLSQGEQVVIVNHSGNDDEALCRQLRDASTLPLDIIRPADALQVKAVIGQAKGVVSSRFHGCVSALSQGVPCLATGWSHKYRELFEEYGCADHIMAPDAEPRKILEYAEMILDNQNSQSLKDYSRVYKEATQAMWHSVFSCLDQSSKTI